MDAAVFTALISLTGTVALAGWTALWTSRQNEKGRVLQERLAENQVEAQQAVARLRDELARAVRDEERRLTAAEELRRHREPLLEAANDLGHRLHNIRQRGFLVYLDPKYGRRDMALMATLYRLAKYFRTVEALYEGGSPLRFEEAEATRGVGDALADIGRAFASDDYDRTDGFASSRFMIWREERRAMGDSVRSNDEGGPVCVGFTEFAARFSGGADKCFRHLVHDLDDSDAADSDRLAVVQQRLVTLVRLLDEDGRFIRQDGIEPAWLREAGAESERP